MVSEIHYDDMYYSINVKCTSIGTELNTLVKKLDKRCKKALKYGSFLKTRVEGSHSTLPPPPGPQWALKLGGTVNTVGNTSASSPGCQETSNSMNFVSGSSDSE